MTKIHKKIDTKYVMKNKLLIEKESVENAKRLFEEAIILKEHQKFCRALFLAIASLEEIAKASLVKNVDDKIPASFNAIVNHKMKLDEIVQLVNRAYKTSIKKEDIPWAKDNRLMEMREDVIYRRLRLHKKDKEYPMFPKEDYWQKRAKAILKKVENVLETYEK